MRKYLIVTMALALVAPVIALAEDDRPKESIQFSYGKIEYKYQSQRDASSGLSSGKRMHKPYAITSTKKKSGKVSVQEMTVTKHVDKSSPILMQNSQFKTTITPHGSNLLGGGVGSVGATSTFKTTPGKVEAGSENIRR